MKRFMLLICLTLASAVLSLAQTPAPQPAAGTSAKPEPKAAALPTLDEVLEKSIKASGGKEAIQKLNSRVGKGSFELPAMGANGTVEMAAKAPNKSYMKIEIAGFGSIVNVFDGKAGYSQDPMSGFRELKGAELAATQIESDFYRDLHMKELYKTIAVKGREKLATGSAIVVEVVPAEGGPEKLYFDETSGLLVRHDAERESPQGKMPIEILFEDFKAVDGVQVPHTIKQTTPAFAITIKIEEMKHNVPVDEAKFNKPSGQ